MNRMTTNAGTYLTTPVVARFIEHPAANKTPFTIHHLFFCLLSFTFCLLLFLDHPFHRDKPNRDQ